MESIDTLTNMLTILGLTMPRVFGALAIAPFFGASSPGGLQRRVFVIASLLVVVPVLAPTLPKQEFSALVIGGLMLKETFIGLLFGFGSGLSFWAMQAAGEYIDLQRGATAGSYFNPFLGGVSSPMGDLLLRFSIMLFLSVGGFTIFFSALLLSFEIYPPWQALPKLDIKKAGAILKFAGQLFELSFLYAAPLLILFLLIDLGLGFMSRFVPSLNVFFFSFPVKSVIGTSFLVMYLSFLTWAFFRNLFNSDSLIYWVRSMLP